MARTYRFFLRNSSVPDHVAEPVLIFEKDEPEIFFQLLTVLRARPQDEIILLNRNEQQQDHQEHQHQVKPVLEHHFQLEQINKKSMSLLFTGVAENSNELKIPLELVLCLPNKPDKLELILQKSVELGASSVVLVEADFSQMKHALRPDRLEKIMIEAAEQSERAIIPELKIEKKLTDFMMRVAESSAKTNFWIAMERLETQSLTILCENYPSKNPIKNSEEKTSAPNLSSKISILIGPEGGFSEAEKAHVAREKLTCFSLGRRILRMETAAIVSLGVVGQYF